MGSTSENCNVAVPKSSLSEGFNGLVNGKVAVILEKNLESVTSSLAINNGDLASPDVRLNMTPENTVQEREPARPIVLSNNLHKFWT